MRRIQSAVTAVLVTLVLPLGVAGCGEDSPGTGTASGAPAGETGASPAAPDLAALDLCGGAGQQSLRTLGYQRGDGTPTEVQDMPACRYEGQKTRVTLAVNDDWALTIGAGRQDEPLTRTTGFPTKVNFESDSSCELVTEVGDAMLKVALENLSGDDPAVLGKTCEIAADIAAEVIDAAPQR